MKKYLLLSFTALFLMSCGNTMRNDWNHFPDKVDLANYNNLQYVKVKQGKSVQVNVSENPSTGYRWEVVSADDCSVNVDNGNYTSDSNSEGRIGAGGTRTYKVSAAGVGTCLVEFQQTGPSEDAPSTRKAIYFIVE